MLRFHPVQQHEATPARRMRLLEEFREVLIRDGMASMDEYGDMLKWALPTRDGMCRYFHVFHPGFCSFSDAHAGTIHYHGGEIRGTVLLGRMVHSVYRAEAHPEGDRFLAGQAYRLLEERFDQPAGTAYVLPSMVPHWTRPLELSLTYFEEEDNGVMGDLLQPADAGPDEHVWTQDDADALVPELLALVEQRLATAVAA